MIPTAQRVLPDDSAGRVTSRTASPADRQSLPPGRRASSRWFPRDRLVGDENFMMRDREARIEGRLGERTSVLRHDGSCVHSSNGIGPGNTFNASSSGVTGFGVLQNDVSRPARQRHPGIELTGRRRPGARVIPRRGVKSPVRLRLPYNADRGLGTRCSESTEATQRYASPGAGSQPSIRSRVTPSYRQASHMCHEARIDEAQYQHARTDHADRTTERPSRRRPVGVHPANNSSQRLG